MSEIKSNADVEPCLSVVMPVYNEAATVAEVIKVVLAQRPVQQLVVVDDASTDGTWEKLQSATAGEARVTLVRHGQNQGKGAALRTGFARATAPVVMVQDADLEWDPADYIRLLSPYSDPGVSVVFGSRLLGSEAICIYPHYYVGGRLLSAFTNLLFGSRITDEPTGFKSFRRAVLDGITLTANGFDFDPDLTGRLLQAGYTIHEVPVRYVPRTFRAGKKVRPRDGLRALWVLLRIRLEGRRRSA